MPPLPPRAPSCTALEVTFRLSLCTAWNPAHDPVQLLPFVFENPCQGRTQTDVTFNPKLLQQLDKKEMFALIVLLPGIQIFLSFKRIHQQPCILAR